MIRNITWGSDGITTTVSGTRFTHAPDCGLHNLQAYGDDWMDACTCFISGIRTVIFPDGTQVPARVPAPAAGHHLVIALTLIGGLALVIAVLIILKGALS